jgi:hypothetical protein
MEVDSGLICLLINREFVLILKYFGETFVFLGRRCHSNRSNSSSIGARLMEVVYSGFRIMSPTKTDSSDRLTRPPEPEPEPEPAHRADLPD